MGGVVSVSYRGLMSALLFSVVLVLLTSGSVRAHEGDHEEVAQGFQYTNELLMGGGLVGGIVLWVVCYWLLYRRNEVP